MFEYFDEPGWSFQLNRIIGEIPDGGGTFGEIERACSRMSTAEWDSWYREWNRLADGTRERTDEATMPTTRRARLLRAANYYRSANFFLDQRTERAQETSANSREAFAAAVGTGTLGAQRISIPFEDGSLPGYYFPTTAPGRLPNPATVVFVGGADSTKEEAFFWGVPRARERGLSCLLFDGPGQGAAIREDERYARPDWETVVPAVADWIDTETDTHRLGMLAASMGGYYGARAAAYCDRLDAVALFSACYDVVADVYDYHPPIQGTLQWLVDADGEDQLARERLSAFTLAEVPPIATDLLLLHGTADSIVDPAAVAKTKEKATAATVEWWPDGEHCCIEDHTPATTVLIDWLTGTLAH